MEYWNAGITDFSSCCGFKPDSNSISSFYLRPFFPGPLCILTILSIRISQFGYIHMGRIDYLRIRMEYGLQRLAQHSSGYRINTAGQTFPYNNDVRNNIKMLKGPQLPGSAEAGLHLV